MTASTTREAEARPIDLRIVVDGASTAGKTTTARSLGERLGRPVVTPAEQDGRTLLFDWMDHDGGRADGRPIRTQVVAVPGHLPHLRARLLVTADVVLFVADTSAAGMHASEVALAQVRTLLDAYEGERPGLVIQANKRDAADALPMDEVTERLTSEGDDPIIETVALTGDGVPQSYVHAVRLGLLHAQAVDGPRIAERQMTADALLRELDQDPRPVREIPASSDDDLGEGDALGASGTPDDGPDEDAVEDQTGEQPAPAAAAGLGPEPEVVTEPEVEGEDEDEVAVAVAGEDEVAAPVPPEPVAVVGAAEEAASTTGEPSTGENPPDERDERALEPVGALGPGPVGDAASRTAADRPEHDHPRAWRRWFDR